MKPSKTCIIWVLLSILLTGVAKNAGAAEHLKSSLSGQGMPNSAHISLLAEYLHSPLWQSRDAYDAAQFLLIPLEYAFADDNATLKKSFHHYIQRLTIAFQKGEVELNTLQWLQHLHLIARYWVLRSYHHQEHVLDSEEFSWLAAEFQRLWGQEPAWLWAHPPFEGIGARIHWKLAADDSALARSYYNVIFDEDYFALSLGLDLYGLYRRAERLDECVGCVEAKELFLRVFENRLQWVAADRWLIDVGRWRDHPDFSHAGYLQAPLSPQGTPLPPAPKADVVIDSSHAHRFPSWLRSAQLALDGEEKAYIARLRLALRKQFLEVIIAPNQSSVPALHNYMDGHNGYFRWGYKTLKGTRKGYGPYDLSATFTLGWWSLLGGEEIAHQYGILACAFPLDTAARLLYAPLSSRRQHPLLTASFDNGIRMMLARMAQQTALALDSQECSSCPEE